MKVSEIRLEFTPNHKGKDSNIEVFFTPHGEGYINSTHRFELILPNSYSGFDVPNLSLGDSEFKVRGTWSKSECKATFRFLEPVKMGTPIRIMIQRSNRILLPEATTTSFRPRFVAGTILSAQSYEIVNVPDLVDEDPMSDLSDDETIGIRDGVRVKRLEHMNSKITDLEVSEIKAVRIKSSWISKEQHRHKNLKHAAMDAAIVDKEIEQVRKHRMMCRDFTRMVKKYFLDLAKRRHFTKHSITLQRVARGMIARFRARLYRSAREIQSWYRGIQDRRYVKNRRRDLLPLRVSLMIRGFLTPKQLSRAECVCTVWRCQMCTPEIQEREWRIHFERLPGKRKEDDDSIMSWSCLEYPKYTWKMLYVGVHLIERFVEFSERNPPPPISSKHNGGFLIEDMITMDPSEMFWRLDLHSMPDERPDFQSIQTRRIRDTMRMVAKVSCMREKIVLSKVLKHNCWIEQVMSNAWKFPVHEMIKMFIRGGVLNVLPQERETLLRKSIKWGCFRCVRHLLSDHNNNNDDDPDQVLLQDLSACTETWASWTYDEVVRMRVGIVIPHRGFAKRRRGILMLFSQFHDGKSFEMEDNNEEEEEDEQEEKKKENDKKEEKEKEWTPPWRAVQSMKSSEAMVNAVRDGLRKAEETFETEILQAHQESNRRVEECKRAVSAAVEADDMLHRYVAESRDRDSIAKQIEFESFERLVKLREELRTAREELRSIEPKWAKHLAIAIRFTNNLSYTSNTQWRVDLVKSMNDAVTCTEYDASATHLRSATNRILLQQNLLSRKEMLTHLKDLHDMYERWEYTQNPVYRSKSVRVRTLESRVDAIESLRNDHNMRHQDKTNRVRESLNAAILRSKRINATWRPQKSQKKKHSEKPRKKRSDINMRTNKELLKHTLKELELEVRARGASSKEVRTKYLHSIRRYSGSGQVVGCSVLYTDLVRRGIYVNIPIFHAMIAACKNATPCRPHLAIRLLDDALRRGLDVKIKHFNSVLDVCARDADYVARKFSAERVAREKEGKEEEILNDRAKHRRQQRHCQWRLAAIAFSMIKSRKNVTPNAITFQLLVRSASGALVEDAPKIYEFFKHHGIPESCCYEASNQFVV